jgi:SAM-dependent methyltransferase
MDLKETDILGSDIERHWYYHSKANAMRRLLEGTAPAKILDVGAGSGFFSRHLLACTDAVEAWCVDISYEADSDEWEAGKAVHYRRSVDTVDADLVLLMDVLEHVDDDVALLKEYVDKVPDGSRFLVTVPAFQFLWSGHDDFLEHKRRYTLHQLERVVRNAGLHVKHGAYFFGAVFPIAATLRIAQKFGSNRKPAHSQLTRHHPIANTILMSLCSMELPLLRINRTAGLTVFCLADKTTPDRHHLTGKC